MSMVSEHEMLINSMQACDSLREEMQKKYQLQGQMIATMLSDKCELQKSLERQKRESLNILEAWQTEILSLKDFHKPQIEAFQQRITFLESEITLAQGQLEQKQQECADFAQAFHELDSQQQEKKGGDGARGLAKFDDELLKILHERELEGVADVLSIKAGAKSIRRLKIITEEDVASLGISMLDARKLKSLLIELKASDAEALKQKEEEEKKFFEAGAAAAAKQDAEEAAARKKAEEEALACEVVCMYTIICIYFCMRNCL